MRINRLVVRPPNGLMLIPRSNASGLFSHETVANHSSDAVITRVDHIGDSLVRDLATRITARVRGRDRSPVIEHRDVVRFMAEQNGKLNRVGMVTGIADCRVCSKAIHGAFKR
jgi:hypothetical protein